MSQSPLTDAGPPGSAVRYRQGWQALNRLLHEDRSFSGHERHCLFVNDGAGRFADASAATGFDLLDDGRALAFGDWDFDGDLDVWTSARTAPRVRLLRNGSPQSPDRQWLGLRLTGDGQRTNRDAVGATVSLHLAGDPRPLTRTVRAGQSFLSQHSPTLHFGLGAATTVERASVHWPGGEVEHFSGLEPGHIFTLTQGRGEAELWQPPAGRRPLELASAPPPDPDGSVLSDPARVRSVLPAPLPLPTLHDESGATIVVDGPAALNLWSATCFDCETELAEWVAARAAFDRAGLKVICLNTDHLTGSPADATAADAIADRLDLPFANLRPSADSVTVLDLFQRAQFDRWQPVPVPATFLVDADGLVTAIYRGRVDADTLAADSKLSTLTPTERRDASTPFTGRWSYDPPPPDPMRVPTQLVDHNLITAASDYLGVVIAKDGVPGFELSDTTRGDAHFVRAVLLKSNGELDAAIDHFSSARDLNPDDFRRRHELGIALASAGRPGEAAAELAQAVRITPGATTSLTPAIAAAHAAAGDAAAGRTAFERALALVPNDGQLHYEFARFCRRTGDGASAAAHFRDALRNSPKLVAAANELARLLASSPDSSVRHGREALALAQRLCSITENRHPGFLDTLAMAQAETGDYAGARATAEAALQILASSGGATTEQLDALRARAATYAGGKPYRDSQGSEPGGQGG